MKVFVKDSAKWSPDATDLPAYTLSKGSWNDYGYYTTFHVYKVTAPFNFFKLGEIKILQKGEMSTELPDEFTQLDDKYFSLGQETSFYEQLLKQPKHEYEFFLKATRDIVFNQSLQTEILNEPCYTKSIIRFSQAEKTLKEAPLLFQGSNAPINNAFEFTFETQLPGAISEHVLDFNFLPYNGLPNRVFCLVGKNGTGKTQLLSRLANALSGEDESQGSFSPSRPPFHNVITLSYSAFDNFELPKSGSEFTYSYWGLRPDGKLLSSGDLIQSISGSYNEIRQKGKEQEWADVINQVLNSDGQFPRITNSNEIEDLNSIDLNRLSSGNLLVLAVVTNIIAKIEKESLILYDEPETHLHPNIIGTLMKGLERILKAYNSYAIIATHSPIVVQQIPSRYVRILERVGNTPSSSELGFECFGESISSIINEVFRVGVEESNYKSVLKELNQSKTYEEIVELFDDKLGINAKSFLKSLG